MPSRVLFCLLFMWSTLSLAAPAPQEEAFGFQSKVLDANALNLEWSIKPNYFLYQQRIWVEATPQDPIHLGAITYPEPQVKINQQGEHVLIYRNHLTLAVPILSDVGGEYILSVHYQGCSDEGFCYPPQTRHLTLSFNNEHALHNITQEPNKDDIKSIETEDEPLITPSAQAKSLLSKAHPIWVMLSFFGFGLLLAFTPCVLPMIPVLSGIIIGHGHNISTRKAFLLSLCYVLSMSLTYGIIGAIIAKLGANLQVIMQSPWIISSFSIIFVLLALSMFDLYEFRLPVAWQSKLATISRHQNRGHYLGAAIMGSMSILILSPCVTPPLIGALSYITEANSALLGLLALFFLGLGMGTPLLVIGASAGKLLPKAGMWMNTIKRFFGILLLGLAIHLISRLISPFITMVSWSALLIFSGLGLKPFSATRSVTLKAIGVMSIAYGIFILYGASAGHTNPWQPLRIIQTLESNPSDALIDHITARSVSEVLATLEQAKQDKQPALLDFYASWCESCQSIEKTILQDPRILEARDHIVLIQVDLSQNDKQSQDLLKYFKVIAPPTFLFYDAFGRAMPELQWEGTIDTTNLLTRIQHAISAEPK